MVVLNGSDFQIGRSFRDNGDRRVLAERGRLRFLWACLFYPCNESVVARYRVFRAAVDAALRVAIAGHRYLVAREGRSSYYVGVEF